MSSLPALLIMFVNFIFAVFVFAFLARPQRMRGLLSKLSALEQNHQEGCLTLEQEAQMHTVGRRWGWGFLGMLLGTSFLTGALIAFLQVKATLP